MCNTSPQYLYHYTSVNTLGFILKSRKFKFNSLEYVDDREEVSIYGTKFGRYCFVSCWTDEAEESIPMWKFYADDLKGVRIKLPILPFKIYNHGGKEYIINPQEAIKDKYFYAHPYKDTFLRKVSYRKMEDMQKFENKEYYEKQLDSLGIDPYLSGEKKNNYWEFQKEWRYILQTIPTNKRIENIEDYSFINGEKKEYILTCPEIPLKDVFLEIDNEIFSEMEILLGPKVNEIDKKIVELLKKEYCPGAKIEYSKLSGKIW